MGFDFIININGFNLGCDSIVEAEALLSAFLLSKVSINKDGKKFIPVVKFEEAKG